MRPELDWARAAAVDALSTYPAVSPWAFEFSPPSSEGAETTYLQKVRQADFVIWLVGAETTPPVRNEIAEALAARRRIWLIRLPAAERSSETQDLVAEVGNRAKYGDVADEDELRALLALTFSDEIVRALRDTPGLTRLALLEQLARMSRARMLIRWEATGLSQAEAIAFADDLSVGAPPEGVLPTSEHPLRIVVADVGAGKSVVGERALQSAIVSAREHGAAPVPVFLHARDCTASFETSVLAACDGLGDPRLQGAYLVVDGLDEVAQSEASVLVDVARVLVSSYPDTRALITSRPSAVVRERRERVDLPPLTHEESQALVNRVANVDADRSIGIHWPRPLDETVRRPLFAILFALDWREHETGMPPTGVLLASLVERAIDRERATAALSLLQRLACLSTERDGGPVPEAEFGGFADRAAVADSRLVVEAGEDLVFALPIFMQWFAAQSLLAGSPDVRDLATEPERLDRWRYAIAIAIATGSDAFVQNLLSELASHDAGFAADVLGESLSRWVRGAERAVPGPIEAGRQLRDAFEAWKNGIAPLDQLLLPQCADGSLFAVAVDAREGWLWSGWHDGTDEDGDVVRFPSGVDLFRQPPAGWVLRRGGQWNADKGWAWQWSHEQLRQDLQRAVKSKELRVDAAALHIEALWMLGVKLRRLGSFTPEPIKLSRLADVLAGVPAGAMIDLDGRLAPADLLHSYVGQLLADGNDELAPPWPQPDLDVRGGWIWKPYSDPQQLERVSVVYAAAIDVYMAIVDAWFAGLRSRMLTAVTLPARLMGEFSPSSGDGFGDTPGLAWHWEALPRGSESEVAISMAPAEPPEGAYDEYLKAQEETHRRLIELRPEASAWASTIYSWGVAADLFQPTPVANVAYKWIEQDLKRIGWFS